MNAEVNYTTLGLIAGRLEGAATALNECGPSAPERVDAGELSGAVLRMLGVAMEGAAGAAEGLGLVAEKVREAVATYVDADDDAGDMFTRLGR